MWDLEAESFKGILKLEKGCLFMKKWTVYNAGNVAWPAGVTFNIVSGTNFKYIQTQVIGLKTAL